MSEPHTESPPSKEYIRDFNSRAIETAVSEILKKIPLNPTKRFDYSNDITIYDSFGKSSQAVMVCDSYKYESDPTWSDLYISIQIESLTIAQRSFFFESKSRFGYIEALSTLNIDDNYKGLHIGSALLYHCEQLKFEFAKTIGTELGVHRMRSVLRDASDPVAWTTQSALALGYKKVRNERGVFERYDNLLTPQVLPTKLTNTWKKQ